MKKKLLLISGLICVVFLLCFVYKSYQNKNLKHIVLLGKPGCGKGTQANIWKQKYNLYHIDGGQLLRNCVKNNCKYKKEIQEVFSSGTLVRNEILEYVITKEFKDHLYCLTCNYKGSIIDGLPRNLETIKIFEENNIALKAVINLNVSDDISKQRVLSRNSGRTDDCEEILNKRLKSFREKTLPVFEYYKQKGLYKEIDANGSKEEVLSKSVEILDKIYKQ